MDSSSGSFVSGPVLAAETENPSYLALHPGGRVLYAVNEVRWFEGRPTGTVSAFAVDPASGLPRPLDRQPSEGTDPCWVVVDVAGRNVLVANYGSGTVSVLPLSPDGRLRSASCVRQGAGSGPVAARQDGPHAHAVVLDASGTLAVWTDLGSDRILIDRFDAYAGRLEPNVPGGVALSPGTGPRHVAWNPSGDALYVVGELAGTVTALRWDASRGTPEVFQVVSARAPWASGENTSAGVVLSPDGRFLYASNRGDDDIAVFSIDRASLALLPVGHVPSGGKGPRSIAVDPSGRWLVAANQRSDSLVVFRLEPATGLPVATGLSASVPEPVFVLFALAAGGTKEGPAL